MSRRLIVSGMTAAAALGALVLIQPAHAVGPRGALCSLAGSAKISPGLGTKAATQKITFSGVKLSNCQEGGLTAAGVPKTFSGSVTIATVTAKASCVTGKLVFPAAIKFSTGKTVNVALTAQGAPR